MLYAIRASEFHYVLQEYLLEYLLYGLHLPRSDSFGPFLLSTFFWQLKNGIFFSW